MGWAGVTPVCLPLGPGVTQRTLLSAEETEGATPSEERGEDPAHSPLAAQKRPSWAGS